MRTRSKTYRFETKLTERISKTAQKLRIGENAYVSQRLSRSITSDTLLQNIDGIGISKDLFQGLISLISNSEIDLLAAKVARNNLPIALESFELDMTPSSVLWFMQEVLQTLGWFRMETVSNEDCFEFKLFHKLNMNWSLFLRSILTAMFSMTREMPEIAVMDRIVKIKFSRQISWHSGESPQFLKNQEPRLKGIIQSDEN